MIPELGHFTLILALFEREGDAAFGVAQTFVSQGFPACEPREMAKHVISERPADRNVGDTADRDVCAPGGQRLFTAEQVLESAHPSSRFQPQPS